MLYEKKQQEPRSYLTKNIFFSRAHDNRTQSWRKQKTKNNLADYSENNNKRDKTTI